MRAKILFLGAICCACRAQDPNSIFLPTSVAADRALAQQGDAGASIRLGYRFLSGTAGVIDPAQAYQFFSSVAAKSSSASAWMGFIAANTPELANKDVDGVGLVRKASAAGDAVGVTLLGRLYHRGNGVSQDRNLAKQSYLAAASKFALAQRYLGELYLESPRPADQAQAASYFVAAANGGDTGSMVWLATMLMRGVGATADLDAAARWLWLAEQRSDIVATYQRGLMYARGRGVQTSRELAASLFVRAASAGYPPAQAALGVCYATGFGVAKNTATAIQWLTTAAPKDDYAAKQLAALKQELQVR